MFLTRGLVTLYSATIDRSKFREITSRVIVFVLPLFFWGRHIQWWGMAIVAFGLFTRAWAAGHLQKDSAMASSGPYLLVRHPLYLGSCLLALGLIVALHHWFVTLTLGGITVLQYWHTIRHEEQNLRSRFGNQYLQYSTNIGAIIPNLKSVVSYLEFRGNPEQELTRFSLDLYLKNREYECLLGTLVVFIFLFISASTL